MPVTVLVGAQWGDKGKGRVADWLARESDVMARYAGGDNAGHTVIVGERTFKLHLVPSGIVYPHVLCLMGSAMVINPLRLVEELDMLASQGVDISPKRLRISERAHIITPGHLALDGASERALGKASIGTTQRGIGPAYMDKAARSGVLAAELAEPDRFAESISAAVSRANAVLTGVYGLEPVNASAAAETYRQAAVRLAPYVGDVPSLLHQYLEAGKRVLCEGAQGTLLDIDHGHYPFVTSSSATVGGALTGLGFGPHYVDRVVGVVKAYCTRVGNGPFPTELSNAQGERMRERGVEFGTTTGRPRRCGWLDGAALRFAVRVNGLTEIVVTKLDVLSAFDELKIAVGYEMAGEPLDSFPLVSRMAEKVMPIYETVPGWQADISGARHLGDLPENARQYIRRIEAVAGVPVTLVSVGPEREQVVSLA